MQPGKHREYGWNDLVEALRHPAVLLSSLTLLTALLYSGTLYFQFVWDDKAQIIDSPLIRSLGNLHRVFISDLWYHTGRSQIYYRPLFVVWSMFNYAIVGLRPWGWHLGAILMHAAACMAVFWLLRKLGLEYWTAALAVLIFALHPIHIECVAWISAVSDSMATMLAAFAFGAYLNGRQPTAHPALWRTMSFALFAGALLTKEIALGFALLVASYELLFSRESGTRSKLWAAVRVALPYLAITASYILLRKLAVHQVSGNADPHHTYVDMLLVLPYVLTFYLRQLVLPIGLTGLYYTPYVTAQLVARLVLPLLILAGVVALIYYWSQKRNDRMVIFAALWILVGLAPALYLRAFENGQFVRDRYIYLGSVGFCVLVAKGLRLLQEVGRRGLEGIAIVILCAGYVALSIPQQAYWYSDLLVYSRGYQLYPENDYTLVVLAREYSRLGAYDRAIPLLEQAQKENSEYPYTAFALASVYIDTGRKEQGRAALIHAEQLVPEYPLTETGAAEVASMWGKLGEYDRALALCSTVLEKEPELFSALYDCGNIQMMAGHYPQAEVLLRRAVEIAPQLAAPKHFLGRTLFLEGKFPEAQTYLSGAVAIDPSIYDYHLWLGRSLETGGDKAQAKLEYQEALRLNETSSEAKMRLAALAVR